MWSKIHDNGLRIGFALFFIAMGALAHGIIVQSGKITWWKERSAELYSVQPSPPAKSMPEPILPRCRELDGRRGDPVTH